MTIALTIGTRGSPLALAQTHNVRRQLAAAHHIAEDSIAIVVIRTSGDIIQDRPLGEVGGKGLFTKELDIALLDGSIDLAVHSAKDLPTAMPDGIIVSGYPEREDVRDVLVSAKAKTIADLPRNAIVGTASLRRGAQMMRLRPDITTTLLRGNVETRLRKAESGEIDATLLALAGLKRLGLAARATSILPVSDFLPAVGQGAVAITARENDERVAKLLAPILHAPTAIALAAERAFLTVLDGSCRTPIAGHATLDGGTLSFHGMVLRADGSEIFEGSRNGPGTDAAALGASAGQDILARLPAGVLAHS